jgi:hypothetical protein
VARGVAEPGRQVSEGEVAPSGRRVERDAQRAVAAGDDGGSIRADALGQPGTELVDAARGDDVQVGAERVPCQLDRSPDPIAARAACPLVEEDAGRRASVRQGSSARSASAEAWSWLAMVKAAPSAK